MIKYALQFSVTMWPDTTMKKTVEVKIILKMKEKLIMFAIFRPRVLISPEREL